MKISEEYRALALDALRGKWKTAVLAGIIASAFGANIVSGSSSITSRSNQDSSFSMSYCPVAGIDVSKRFSDMCILSPDNKIFAQEKIYHDETSINRANALLQKAERLFFRKPVIVMESTSHYHLILFQFFSEHGYDVIVVNPLQSNSMKDFSIRKRKTDRVDSFKLAMMYVANEPKVSFRNGQFIVTDGQHTIEGRILRNGGKDLPILCKVYTGMTVEQEALLFAEQNGFSAPLTAGIKLRAKVVGGDAISKAFLAATNRVGLSLNYDSQQLTDYRIGCVGTAFRLYKQMGEPLYCETMRLIVAAWEGKPDSFRASVLKGMMHFVELYHGEFSEERLLRALRNIHPVDIYRIGQDDPAKLRGWKKYVFPIYTAYNGKCRKDALPMKF